LKFPRADLSPTANSLLLLQLGVLLIVIGVALHVYEYFAGALAVFVYVAAVGIRFQRQLASIRPNLAAERRLDRKRGHVGDVCGIEVEIWNRTNQTVHLDHLEDRADLNGSELVCDQLGRIARPNQKTSIRYETRLQQTGLLTFGWLKLWVTDARRLYVSTVLIQAPAKLEVDAPVLVSEMQLTPMQLYGGATEQRRIGPSGTDYAATRAYLPGDDLHRIDWKATARLGKLMVREFHADVASPVITLLDAGPNMSHAGFLASRFEEALAVARLVGENALDAGDPFGFGIFDRHALREHFLPQPNRSGIQALHRIGRQTKVKPPRGVLPEPRLPVTRRSIRKRLRILEALSEDSLPLKKLAAFVGNARLVLPERLRRTGPYRALRAMSDLVKQPALVIVLTDLQGDLEGLLEGVRYSRSRGHHTVIAQIASAWRLEEGLEAAYVKYESNRRIIERLREEETTVLDTRPEQVLGAIGKEIAFGKLLGGLAA
jgi:uncharacterized protein (DUF58 family)